MNTLKHIAFIMDGNGRWAEKRRLLRMAGHVRGAAQLKKIIDACLKHNIAHVTLYAFSTENWSRPLEEVRSLMGLFLKYLEKEVETLSSHGVRLRVLGDLSAFNAEIQAAIEKAEKTTAHCDKLNLYIAANYGGRMELVGAVKQWMEAHPGAASSDFTAESLEPYLLTRDIPEPDLLIRTGGECRLSNFLLWQTAYTELYFTPVLWPDFNDLELAQAIKWFNDRERRFGKTSEQIRP